MRLCLFWFCFLKYKNNSYRFSVCLSTRAWGQDLPKLTGMGTEPLGLVHSSIRVHCAPWAVLSDQVRGVNQDACFVLLYPIWGVGVLKQNPWELLVGKISFICEVFGLQMKNSTGKCFWNSCIELASMSRLKGFLSASSPCSWSLFEIVGERGRLPGKNQSRPNLCGYRIG